MAQNKQLYQTKINTDFLISLLWIGTSFAAKEPKWVIDFGGAIRLYLPYHHTEGSKTLVGFTSMTSEQLNYKKCGTILCYNSFIRYRAGSSTVRYSTNSDIKKNAKQVLE